MAIIFSTDQETPISSLNKTPRIDILLVLAVTFIIMIPQ
jgi:biopolymer transport protein ExbD